MPHSAVNLLFTQVSSYKMELALQYLSARVFIMAHRTHRDTYFSKDAAFGEVTTEMERNNSSASLACFFFLYALPFCLFSVCMGGVWNCTETNCSGTSSLSGHLMVEEGKSGYR